MNLYFTLQLSNIAVEPLKFLNNSRCQAFLFSKNRSCSLFYYRSMKNNLSVTCFSFKVTVTIHYLLKCFSKARATPNWPFLKSQTFHFSYYCRSKYQKQHIMNFFDKRTNDLCDKLYSKCMRVGIKCYKQQFTQQLDGVWFLMITATSQI